MPALQILQQLTASFALIICVERLEDRLELVVHLSKALCRHFFQVPLNRRCCSVVIVAQLVLPVQNLHRGCVSLLREEIP
jgi:hypothetical protein